MSDKVKVYECKTYHTGPHVDQNLFNGPPGRYVLVEDVKQWLRDAHLDGANDQIDENVRREDGERPRMWVDIFESSETAARLRALGE